MSISGHGTPLLMPGGIQFSPDSLKSELAKSSSSEAQSRSDLQVTRCTAWPLAAAGLPAVYGTFYHAVAACCLSLAISCVTTAGSSPVALLKLCCFRPSHSCHIMVESSEYDQG